MKKNLYIFKTRPEGLTKKIFLISSLFVFGLFASGPLHAEIGEQSFAAKGPIIYDIMTFRGKPDLNLSQDMNFIYEWEASLRDEGTQLKSLKSYRKPSSRTIEHNHFTRAIKLRAGYKYIVIDIESLPPSDDSIAIKYIELAKAAAPKSKSGKNLWKQMISVYWEPISNLRTL